MRRVKNKKDLADAIAAKESTIEIEGNLAKRVIRIKATGPVAWGIAIGAIGIAAFSVHKLTSSQTASSELKAAYAVSSVASFAVGAVTATSLGFSTTAFAVGLAIASGGTAILTSIYSDYDIADRTSNSITLNRKATAT